MRSGSWAHAGVRMSWDEGSGYVELTIDRSTATLPAKETIRLDVSDARKILDAMATGIAAAEKESTEP